MKVMDRSGYSHQNYWRYLFLLVFCVTLVFNIFKLHVGYVYNDEAFYLTLGQRLLQGDVKVVDEYHVAQLLDMYRSLDYING